MKSMYAKSMMILVVLLFSETSLLGQVRLFRNRNRPTLRNKVNPAHEKAKTEADQAYSQGNYQRSVDLTNQVIAQNRNDHVAYYLRASARAELALRKSDARAMRAAVADAREAIRLGGMKNPIYYLPYLYGMTHLSVIEGRKEHAEIAVKVANQVIQMPTLKAEEKANLYYQSGTSHVVLKKFVNASRDFSAAMKLNPTHLGAYLGAADAFAQAGQPKKAIEAYSAAVKSFPDNPLVFNNRGMAYQSQNQLGNAIVDFTRALEIDEKYYYAYTNRGYCLLLSDDPSAAEADFTASLKVNSSQPMVYGFRASSRLKQSNFRGAIDDNRTVVRLTPRNPTAYADLGFALFFSTDYAAAEKSFAQAISLDANQRHLNPWRFLSVERSRNKAAAQQQFASSLKKKTTERDWVDALIAFLAGNSDADTLLKSINTKDNTVKLAQQCEAHFFIGVRKAGAGQQKAAMEDFKKSTATKQAHLSAFQGSTLALKPKKQ
jgi:lipoprotein NlpI